MKFKRGTPKPPASGRKSGTPNKHSVIFKTAVANVFREGGGEGWLLRWARKNPGEFFAIAARLTPKEVVGDFSVTDDVPRVTVVLPYNNRGPAPGETQAEFDARDKAGLPFVPKAAAGE